MSIERSLKIYKGLVEVSALLVAITDLEELLPAILEIARRVMNAESSALFLIDEEGALRLSLTSGRASEALKTQDVQETDLILPREGSLGGWVLSHRRTILVPDASIDPRVFRRGPERLGIDAGAILCAPLFRGETEIGVLQVLNSREKATFEETDLEAFEAFANLAATAIDRVRGLARLRSQQRIEQELAMAHQIQSSFLPQAHPCRDNLTFASHYRPAKNVSGDFYDLVDVSPDEIFFAIGDVAGRGVPAALLMAQSLSIFRMILRPGISPAETLALWNKHLVGKIVPGVFITAAVGKINPTTREVQIANAGHCLPLASRQGGGVEELSLQSAPPLGLLEEFGPIDNHLTMQPGEFLLSYTDGFSESRSPEGIFLGKEGALAALERPLPSVSEVVYGLTQWEENHRNGMDATDDLTLLAFGFR